MQNKNEQENYFQSIHPPVFFHRRANECQCTDQMKWDKITWKKYLADEKKAEGLLCLPQDGRLQRMSIP